MCSTWKRSGSSSRNRTRCGFPIDTALAVTVRPLPMSKGCARNVSHAAPNIGICALVKPGVPMPTVASRAGPSPRERDVPEAGRRGDVERRLLGQLPIVDVCAEAPHAVARHRGRRAVRVREVEPEPPLRGTGEADHAIGAHARPPVAERADVDRRQGPRILGVLHDDEVVAGSLVLGEGDLAHTVASRWTRMASTASTAPSSPTGNHRMRGSRRNQAICRRARFRVRFTIRSTASSSVMAPCR